MICQLQQKTSLKQQISQKMMSKSQKPRLAQIRKLRKIASSLCSLPNVPLVWILKNYSVY